MTSTKLHWKLGFIETIIGSSVYFCGFIFWLFSFKFLFLHYSCSRHDNNKEMNDRRKLKNLPTSVVGMNRIVVLDYSAK